MKTKKLTWLFVSLTLLLSACNLGPLSEPTPTPPATATPSQTPAPTSTETPTVTATAPFFPTQTLTPTAITCPKGTVLLPSVNRCFYATRTPKVEEPYCVQFTHKWACINNGCFWDRSVKSCK
jgi:hypothetical protein